LPKQFDKAYPQLSFRGLHDCSLCLHEGSQTPHIAGSHRNIFVPGESVVYIAPAGIVHYINTHSYLPPAEFIEAVSRCPDPSTDIYYDMLRAANDHKEPPIEQHRKFRLANDLPC
jgi:hypothetical protein